MFGVYVTHSFDFKGVIDEAQDDIGDSDKDRGGGKRPPTSGVGLIN